MPKPKKKRTKRYDPTRYAEKPPMMSWQTAEEIKAMYRDVQLAVELRLHRGEFDAIRAGLEVAGEVINACIDADPVRVSELFLCTEDLHDLPEDVHKRTHWLDVKLEKIRRWRTRLGYEASEARYG